MASVRGQSTDFLDALGGPNGMADPMPSRLALEVMADPTALPAVVDSVSLSAGLPSAVLPGPWPASPPPPTGPAFIAPAPALFTPRAVPRTAATRPVPPAGRRPAVATPPAPRRPPNAANVSYASTPYAQPFAPPPGRPALRPSQPAASLPRPGLPSQLTALQAQLRQQALAGRGRRPPKKKKTNWGGVFVLLVFVFLFLLGSGLFGQIWNSIEQVLHR